MKALAAGIGVVCLSPLLLAGTALSLAAAAQAAQQAGQCLTGPDAGKISRQVDKLLDGADPGDVTVEGLTLPEQQLPHARTIVATGISLDVPGRGQVVALATAMQESRLRNLAYGDRDSLGLFQQRPSQGWGTAAQIRDPVHASKRFYQALLDTSGWQQMTIAQAAQAVQRSAFPDAYAQWEPLATALQQAIGKTLPATGPGSGPASDDGTETGPPGCTAEDGTQYGPIPEGAVPEGYAIPRSADPRAAKAITWAMRQLGTMYQWGGSCTAPRGPDPMGRCDCSSLMQQAYAHASIELTRTTYTQVGEGKAVPADRLRPGDLIFSRGSAARPEHVGMYLGEGLVIEAPRTGKPVRITPLADWTVLAARRVA
ncbi:C40 family peptidase [Streptomyces sp. DSM 42041]|uniref:C40 family peptidase n=1 Tax=Streptomyces hazeniae TaxID=3075538 RepID=A0ABU2P0E8_9ACTN|nr:C40 family peptidase [Streptomyces sp. DSM 42041]MDT0382311.1 C40 family peptidase [Streptomyces sp. DSM 42041]